MEQWQQKVVSIVADSYLQYAESIVARLHALQPETQWKIDWQVGRRLEQHAWKVQPADRCLAVISGNDLHRKSKRSSSGVLSQSAWDNNKKDIIFGALSRLWNHMSGQARCGARIIFFGTGQNFRNRWPSASEDDLERFSAFMRLCEQYCVESGMDAVWYRVDHISLSSDGWHPTITCSDAIARDLIGVVREMRMRDPQLLASHNHTIVEQEYTPAESHQREGTPAVADSCLTLEFILSLPEDRNRIHWKEIMDQTFPERFLATSRLLERSVLRTLEQELPTVLILTSGNDETEKQSRLCALMFKYLGWSPLILDGVSENQFPSKSLRIGAKSGFSYTVSFLPKICSLLRTGGVIVVAEDSCHPTCRCTPECIRSIVKMHGNVWLGGVLSPKDYTLSLYDRSSKVRAQAGCKLFVGSASFWDTAFSVMTKLPKTWSADSLFQSLVPVGNLHLLELALAGSMCHMSARRSIRVVGASKFPLDGPLVILEASPFEADGLRNRC